MLCQEIKSKQLWDTFVTSQPIHTFLHSWAWGEFNEAMGERVWRFGVYNCSDSIHCIQNQENLVAVAQVIKVHAKRGNFLFVPHGPILAKGEKSFNFKFLIFKQLADALKKLAKHKKVSFIRISPVLNDTDENKKLFRGLGFRPAPIHMHAETTWTLDLTPSEDELLMGMRKTTRNLIRRAMREGVEVKQGNTEQDVERFYELYRETVKKHHFTPFSLTYLKNQVRIMPDVTVFTAYYQGKPLASAIIVFYGASAFYHHGASIPSKIQVAHLLQWAAIREAKCRGHKFYNFWGIIDSRNMKHEARNKHPWAGLTLFKTGFGGFQMDYMHAQDLPLSPFYWINWYVETIRRRRRNL